MQDLRQEFSDRLTEISIQHIPDQPIFVELQGTGPVAERVVRTDSGDTRVVFEVGHTHTQQAFSALVERHRGLIYRAIPGVKG